MYMEVGKELIKCKQINENKVYMDLNRIIIKQWVRQRAVD
jgi:hypothetical protein